MGNRRYTSGDVIYREGDPATAIYVIESGTVEVSRRVDGKPVRLSVFAKGDIFGETGVIRNTPHSTTMTALDAVSLFSVSREDFLASFNEDNPFSLPLLRMLSARLSKADERMLAVREEERRRAAAAEVGRLLLRPGSDYVARFIGRDGVTVGSLPYSIGQRTPRDGRATVTDRALAIPGVNDFALSPDHFAIEKRGGELILRDLGSHLGTLVNGRYISRYSHSATAPLFMGSNDVTAGPEAAPDRFKVVAEGRGG